MAAIIVHGGAFAIPSAIRELCVTGCRTAADEGYKVLKAGSSALDAVETAVRSLEDNPIFNSGHGSSLNKAGEIEMDAIIVDGSTLGYGAVAGVKGVSNPISLARMVMDKTSHVMLIGEGAKQFAAEMGIPTVDTSELITSEATKIWEDYQNYDCVVSNVYEGNLAHDTVGAVTLDLKGNLAAATSTGGITLKRVGRVGASALIGSGAYCDNNLGGVSCTGHGESIAKVLLAYRALSQLQNSSSAGSVRVDLEQAFENSLGFMSERVYGKGGMIGISKDGTIAKHHTTTNMSWASVDQDGVMKSGV